MKGWQGVGEWFNGVTKWFNEIDIGIKIGVGLLLFAAACALVIISAPTGAAGLTGAIAAYTGTSSTIAAATVTSMAIAFAVGIASATAMSAAGALLSGGDVVEAMTNAAADAVFWGGVFAFVSAGVNALKTVARTTYNAKLPGSSQTGGQACSTVNQCFKEGTLVETEEGLKPIEEIAVGDKVLAYDEATGEQAYKEVTRLFRNTTKEWQYVYIEGETEPIISTPGHKYYLPENNARREDARALEHASYAELSEKWVSACDLKPGDKVLLSDGKYGIIKKSETVIFSAPETTYNLEVADFHTYYVFKNKVLVHNRGCSNLKPESSAKGDHTTFKRDVKTGKVTHYATYKKNPLNPSGFDEVLRFDGVGGAHVNKLTLADIPTPHIHGKTIPGGVGIPEIWQLPKGY